MRCLTTLAKQKRVILMKTKNDWKVCLQTKWENGDFVEVEELYSGKHRINVSALGIKTSYEIPSYAAFVHYEKWVNDVHNGELE